MHHYKSQECSGAMAQAPAPAMDGLQFSCSICLELLRDPVTVPCGHSYCRTCLSDYWDRQRKSSCPQCRAVFSPRPKLGRNNLLVEMMEQLGVIGPSAPPMQEVVGFEHPTFDVSSVHPERTNEQRLVGETRRHIAAELKRKEQEVHQLRKAQTSFSRQAKAALKDNSGVFLELQQFLERRRVEMKELIRAQEKAELARAENHLQHLERQMLDLRRRDGELQRLCQLQEHNLIHQMCQAFTHPTPSDVLTLCPGVSFGAVRNAVCDLKEQLQSLYLTQFPEVTAAVKTVNLLQINSTAELCSSAAVPPLDSRFDLLHYFTPLSLDVFSAHKELFLSQGNRAVSRTGEVQPYPDHPERFDMWTQVLCREALQGRSYWEAEWDGQVTLGVAYGCIGRKGSSDHSRLGHNPVSWSLQCGPSFSFSHAQQTQELSAPPGSASNRVGVFLDHEAGLLCFYTVADGQVRLLHRQQDMFSQPVFAALWLGSSARVSLCTVD